MKIGNIVFPFLFWRIFKLFIFSGFLITTLTKLKTIYWRFTKWFFRRDGLFIGLRYRTYRWLVGFRPFSVLKLKPASNHTFQKVYISKIPCRRITGFFRNLKIQFLMFFQSRFIKLSNLFIHLLKLFDLF